jgi:type I restriction enzyme S subunit
MKDAINIETGSMNLDENTSSGKYPFYTRNVGLFFADKYTNDTTGVIVAGEGNFSPKYVIGKFALHQRAYLIAPKNNRFSSEVLFEIIKANKRFLETVAVGSTVRSLRRFCFETMPYYSDVDYSCLAVKLSPIFERITDLQKRIDYLNTTKQALLVKYFED